ncbi:ABC transporter substrate binding protein [Desulfocicer niacini]
MPFIFRSHRDEALARKNLTQMDGMGFDLIISFSSAGTRIAQSMALQTPVIATVINHPISLGMQRGEKRNSIALTGTSYYVDTEKQLALYREIAPHLSRVGMIYDSNNPSGYLAEEPLMRKACEKLGLSFFSRGIVAPTDPTEATRQLVDTGIDLIIIPINQELYALLDAVFKITIPLKIPVVSMSKQGVDSGALAGLFGDAYKLGRRLVPIARQILVDKTKASEIPFIFIQKPDLIINLKYAQDLDYEFSPAILGRAAIILD